MICMVPNLNLLLNLAGLAGSVCLIGSGIYFLRNPTKRPHLKSVGNTIASAFKNEHSEQPSFVDLVEAAEKGLEEEKK